MSYSSNEQVSHNRRMILTGKGQVTATPDLAILRLGVQTTGENLSNVQTENAELTQAVLSAIRQLGVNEIQTHQYTIDKLFEFENGTRIDRGYSVRNILEIKTQDLDLVGALIDTAVANGANVVDFISFEFSEADRYYRHALNLALRDAFQKAESITDSLGITFNHIPYRITESTVQVSPFTPIQTRGELAFSTPIEAGSTIIEASVIVEFEY